MSLKFNLFQIKSILERVQLLNTQKVFTTHFKISKLYTTFHFLNTFSIKNAKKYLYNTF
jgi:hypothetical protein